MGRISAACLAACLVLLPAAGQAQDTAASASPSTGAVQMPVYELPDPASLTMPKLAFTETPEIAAGYDKYFVFNRGNTSFAEAFTDIKECDALASGSSIYMGADSGSIAAASAQYGMLAGAAGGAIASVAMDLIFGSGARREQYRVNMRNCMGFKGYGRYGLSEDLWKEFNFQEGNGRKKEGVRDEAMELQALVAAGPRPASKELGL